MLVLNPKWHTWSNLSGTGNLQDQMFAYFRGEGYTGSIDDMMLTYLRAHGHYGSIEDMLHSFEVRTSVLTLPVPAFNANFTTQNSINTNVTVTRASPKYVGRQGDGQLYALGNNEIAIDHDGSGNPLGLLIEESRENIVLQSEDTETTWSKDVGLTTSSNSAVAPDGATTADTIIDGNAAGVARLRQTVAIPLDTTTYCISLFIKKDTDEARFPAVFLIYGAALGAISINTATGEVVEANGFTVLNSGSIDHGDYWRVWFTKANDSNASALVDIRPAQSLTIDGAADNSVLGSIVIWGMMLEAGLFPSSYTKTTTVAVTREADDIDLSSFSFFNPSQGTIAVLGQVLSVGNSANQNFVQIDDGGATDTIRLYVDSSDAVAIQTINSGGNNGFSSVGPVAANTEFKAAGTYVQDDVRAFLIGVADATPDFAADLPPTDTLTAFRIGRGDSDRYLNGHIKKLIYWTQVLDAPSISEFMM